MKKYIYPLILTLITIGLEYWLSYGNEYQSLAYSIIFIMGIFLSVIIAVAGAVVYVWIRKGSCFLFWYAGFLGLGNFIAILVLIRSNV